MPRGGLSSDPEKRARQLAGLKRGAENAGLKLQSLLDSPADGPAKPGKPTVDRVDYTEPAKRARSSAAKRKPARQTTRRKDAEPPPPEPAKPYVSAELPGFVAGLRAPFERSYG